MRNGTSCPSRKPLKNGYCQRHQRQALLEASAKWTRERLEAAIAEHGGPEGMDLTNADLSGLDLSRIDLHGADLSWAILSQEEEDGKVAGANLRGANLQGASLVEARLRKTRLMEADLRGANLTGADLRAASLFRANLDDANLARASLRGASLAQASLQRASLMRADLQGVDAEAAILEQACLDEAKLIEVPLAYANLRGATLVGANLREAYLFEADLGEADLRADLRDACLEGARLRGARLWDADLRGADLTLADMEGADLSGANLRRANLRVTKLHDAILRQCDLRGADLSGASLEDATLAGADCTQVNLRDVADGGLRGVRFYRARLDHTLLGRCQLGKAIAEEEAEEFQQAAETYPALKQNFDALGDYSAAAWSYVQECRMEAMCSHPCHARGLYGPEELGDTDDACLSGWNVRVWCFCVRHTARYLGYRFVDWLCGYGESWLKTLRAMGLTFLVFAAIYWLTWAVVRETPRPSGIVDLVPTRNPVDVLVFSAGAFTTMDPRGVGPLAPWVQFVATVEALLGIGLTGLLGFVLGNRIRRS